MTELRSPCSVCDLRDEDKNTGKCKKCIDQGIPLKYCQELGGLTESLPIDICLNGYGGIDPTDPRDDMVDEDEMMIEEICRDHNVAYKNLVRGSVGAPFHRARVDIVRYFLDKDENMGLKELSKIVGISFGHVGKIIRRIKVE